MLGDLDCRCQGGPPARGPGPSAGRGLGPPPRISLSQMTMRVKSVAVVAVPVGVLTVIRPVVALLGTLTWSWCEEIRVTSTAIRPLNRTSTVPTKPRPLRVTSVPTSPVAGVNPEIDGGAVALSTVKLL